MSIGDRLAKNYAKNYLQIPVVLAWMECDLFYVMVIIYEE